MLRIAFLHHGGPREQDAYVAEFRHAILFHLPAILHAPACLRVATTGERETLVPTVSYDADELGGNPGGYDVVMLESPDGVPLGYYIAAEEVSGAWHPRSDLRGPWGNGPTQESD